MIKGYTAPIESLTKENADFRKVLYTAPDLQLVLMCLKPGEEIGAEVHEENDQFFRFEEGQGEVRINDETYRVSDGDVAIIPRGARHNVVNTSTTAALKMYTIYAPPHHKDGIVRVSKDEAEQNEEEFDGVTTE